MGTSWMKFLSEGLEGKTPPPPIVATLGFQMVGVEAGKATVAFEAEERHANAMGTLHGGVRRARTVCYLECEIFDPKGSLVAKVSSTCMVLRAEAAQGR